MPFSLILFLIIITIFRIGLAMLFPLTADESYYWLWSKHLAFSYVDHPPLIGYINFLTTFGSENLFNLRLSAAAIALIVSLLIYFLAKESLGEKVAFWSAILFHILPHFLIIWLTMFVEVPLVLFWTAAIFILSKIIRPSFPPRLSNSILWCSLAVILGLGYLTKYTMFLFWPSLILFLVISPQHRFWLAKKEPYLCFFLSILFFLPVLYWNSQNNWISFVSHGARIIGERWGINLLPFIADQLVHFSPFLLALLIPIFFEAYKGADTEKLLFSFSAPLLVLFLLLSTKVKVWAHWPSIGYVSVLPLLVNYLIRKEKSLPRFFMGVSTFTAIILLILFLVTPAVLRHQSDYAQNYDLPNRIPLGCKIFAQTYAAASLFEFYSRRPVYLATGFLKPHPLWGEKQYEIWGIPSLETGEDIIYYGEYNSKFKEYFKSVKEIPQIKLYLIEDYLNKFKAFKLEGFKGGGSHP